MDIGELGSLGELLSSIAVLITLTFLLVEMKRNNKIQERQNAKETARDNNNALQAILAEDVSEIFMRGNSEGLGALTAHERYRYDIAYYLWLQTIQEAYADFRAGYYPKESLTPWANSVQGFLSSNGGAAWWKERQFWFSQEFRSDVDELLSSYNPEADFSGQFPKSESGT
jgi:hypothetical protein